MRNSTFLKSSHSCDLVDMQGLEQRSLLSANVLGFHGDNTSTGVNSSETVLAPANVVVAHFRKLGSTKVDGQVYAQPLYVSGVQITTGLLQGLHNVVYVATEHDSLYAIDSGTGQVLWKRSFINPAAGLTTVPAADTQTDDITGEVGITSTPVIDPVSHSLFLVAKSKQQTQSNPRYMYTLYKVNIQDGSSVGCLIASTESDGVNYIYRSGPYVPGTGDGAIKVARQSRVYFNALRELQRTGLTLSGGRILIGFASHGDNGPFHGWLLSYDEAILGLRGVLNTTPNGGDGGIWQSGGIVAADAAGVLYVATGNGTFDGDAGGNGKVIGLNSNGFPVNADYGNCFLKIVVDSASTIAKPNKNGWGLKVVDYFSPYNNHDLDALDTDLGSGGLLLLPDSAGSARHRHLLVGAGKQGMLYLVDRDNMGKFHLGGDAVVQSVESAIGGSYDTPAFFNGRLYYTGADDQARMFKVAAGHISDPTSQSADTYAFPGSTPTISANGIAQGIVWDLDRGTNQLRAYDAANYAHELWTSARAPNGRDALGRVVKFTVPAVADGEVFVGTATALVRYGLAATPP